MMRDTIGCLVYTTNLNIPYIFSTKCQKRMQIVKRVKNELITITGKVILGIILKENITSILITEIIFFLKFGTYCTFPKRSVLSISTKPVP